MARVNNLLVGLIILINAYVIVTPFVPQLIYWYEKNHTSQYSQLEKKVSTPAKTNPKSKNSNSSSVQANSLIVPSMLLDQPIYQGPTWQTYQILAKGIWLWPKGSTPDKGGNTILIGHRFTYTSPRGVFYELNQVKLNDQLALWWNGIKYTYVVTSINIVPPTQTSILNPTTNPQLTLYTCTPLFNPVSRLVVVANLESET